MTVEDQQSVEVDHTYLVIHTSSPFGLKNPAANICEVKVLVKCQVLKCYFNPFSHFVEDLYYNFCVS